MEHFRCGLSPTKKKMPSAEPDVHTDGWVDMWLFFYSLCSCILRRSSVIELFAILRRPHALWADGAQPSGCNLLKAPPHLTDTTASATVYALTHWRTREMLFKNPEGDVHTTDSKRHIPSHNFIEIKGSLPRSQQPVNPKLNQNNPVKATLSYWRSILMLSSYLCVYLPQCPNPVKATLAYWRSILMLPSYLCLYLPQWPNPVKATQSYLRSILMLSSYLCLYLPQWPNPVKATQSYWRSILMLSSYLCIYCIFHNGLIHESHTGLLKIYINVALLPMPISSTMA
jgi:hypothetical protein